VVVGVGGVVELRGHEGLGVGSQQIPGAGDGALHALGFRECGSPGAEGPHDDGFSSENFSGIKQPHLGKPRTHADQRQADAGVSGGGFDDGASPLQLAFTLGALDQANGGAIFHRLPPGFRYSSFGEDVGPIPEGPAFFNFAASAFRRPSLEISSLRAGASLRSIVGTLQSKEREGERQWKEFVIAQFVICNFETRLLDYKLQITNTDPYLTAPRKAGSVPGVIAAFCADGEFCCGCANGRPLST